MTERIDVIVGTVGRAHGLRGEVTVFSRTDHPRERFAPGRTVRTGAGRTLTVAGVRAHQGTLLLRFVEIPDRSAAEALRGCDLWSSVEAAEVPADDQDFYDRHLIGLAARTADGREVGSVTAVMHLPAQDVIVLGTPAGERLIPFVEALVPEVDVTAGFLVIAPIPGLLDDGEDVPRED